MSDATLLIVDDHPLFVEGFVVMVERLRLAWSLTTAASGGEALAKLAETRPGAAIIDVFLLIATGSIFCTKWRAAGRACP